MPSDLAALTPPLLVALVFPIAVGAFIRHEMRSGRNRPEDEEGTDSAPDSSDEPDSNDADPGSPQRSFGEHSADRDQDRGDPPDRDPRLQVEYGASQRVCAGSDSRSNPRRIGHTSIFVHGESSGIG